MTCPVLSGQYVYQPLNEQLEVFVVGASGVLNVVWKDNNGIWKRPFALTGAAFAMPGAHVAGRISFPTSSSKCSFWIRPESSCRLESE